MKKIYTAQNPSSMEGGVLGSSHAEMEALERLRRVSPPQYLTESPELSILAREASAHIFSSLIPFCAKSSPVDRLLVDENFDAEQIWHQIELQNALILPALRKDLKREEKMDVREMLGVEVPLEEEKDLGAEDGKDDAEEVVDGEERNINHVYSEDEADDEDAADDEVEDDEEEAEEDEDEDELLIEHEVSMDFAYSQVMQSLLML